MNYFYWPVSQASAVPAGSTALNGAGTFVCVVENDTGNIDHEFAFAMNGAASLTAKVTIGVDFATSPVVDPARQVARGFRTVETPKLRQ